MLQEFIAEARQYIAPTRTQTAATASTRLVKIQSARFLTKMSEADF